MALNKNVYQLKIDIKSRTTNVVPSFVQYDDARLEFQVYDGGALYDLDGFTSVEFAHLRPDGTAVVGLGEITEDTYGNKIVRYDYKGSEMTVLGTNLTSFSLVDAEGDKVSVHPFRVNIVDDLRDTVVDPANPEYGLLQELIAEVNATLGSYAEAYSNVVEATEIARTATANTNKAISDAETATVNAIDATDDAIEATAKANTSATNADTSAAKADTAAANADEKAQAAQTAKEQADQAAKNARDAQESISTEVTKVIGTANTAAERANTAATTAQSKADYITSKEPAIDRFTSEQTALQTQINDLTKGLTQDAEVIQARKGNATLNDRLNKYDAQLDDTNRQTSVLTQGANVVNATTGALANVEVEGRTLTSLANSNLEAGKKYVIADRKTKVIVDGQTVSGVGKFTKGQTNVTTATFRNKTSGNLANNPHKGFVHLQTELGTPSSITSEMNDNNYSGLISLDNFPLQNSRTFERAKAQQLFSFNIIEQIERTLGLIPKTTLAEKVQWVKDNVERIEAHWHGFGTSASGNKATLALWNMSNNSWGNPGTTNVHTKGIISKISYVTTNALNIDSNGLTHYLAFSEESDGTIASTINTDYVELIITLKTTAQLNTRPRIIRVADFEGKVSGSMVENPHVSKFTTGTSLMLPINGSEPAQIYYDRAMKLGDSQLYGVNASGVGSMAQELFSFNIIESVERNICKIPRNTIADKVTWLKNNLYKVTANWHGYGTSAGGNKATFTVLYYDKWNQSGVSVTHTSNVASKLGLSIMGYIPNSIDTNGFVHYLAYSEPSDGTVTSVINTDYIELEIELKPDADFTNPRVPLYEVSDAEYAKILTDWNADEVVKRYPAVEGVKHIQGLSLTAEGENLLPPFTEWDVINANVKILAPYHLELTNVGLNNYSYKRMPTEPNKTYTISIDNPNGLVIKAMFYDKNSVYISGVSTTTNTLTFTTPQNCYVLGMEFTNLLTESKLFVAKNPMLTLGSQPKPFVPRNPSSLLMDVKLGKVGNVADMVYEQDGRWLLRKAIEKDVSLDSITSWTVNSAYNYTNYKRVVVNNFWTKPISSMDFKLTKFDGAIVRNGTPAQTVSDLESNSELIATGLADRLDLTVPNVLTGFTNTMIPGSSDWKRYFNGWKYTDGTTWTSVTGNGQTATGQQALDTKPTDYTPYKLSYVLATPVITDITDKVEGALKINGQTQVNVETGLVVREKVNPTLNSGAYFINALSLNASSHLKNNVIKILAIYKNGVLDTSKWVFTTTNSKGLVKAHIIQADYDPTATYTVTYIAEPITYTTVPTNVKLTYASNVRTAVNDVVTAVQDAKLAMNLQERSILDLYVKVRALQTEVVALDGRLDIVETPPTPPVNQLPEGGEM